MSDGVKRYLAGNEARERVQRYSEDQYVIRGLLRDSDRHDLSGFHV